MNDLPSSDDAAAIVATSSHEPRWCVVANVVDERLHGSEGEHRRGTKHFSAGTKVYLVSAYWGMGGETVTVLGRARRPKRWITVDVRAVVLENWRVKLIYEPAVLRRLGDREHFTEDEADRAASLLRQVASTERVRLFDRTATDVEQTLRDLRGSGSVVLRASIPGPAGGVEFFV